ncbi:MAG: GNAT family N-acetyltransferase [Candidatus Saccharimonas sp.]|nr:GNAT family N-acetyltransferase [Planctomycetaceae bacterium]
MDVVLDMVVEVPVNALEPLVVESAREGWQFVRRLAEEWSSGVNRFDRPGEQLHVARAESLIVGVCGLNLDPYANESSVGRVRRLYVIAEYRCTGIGRRLVQAVVAAAAGHFRELRVRTQNPDAAKLYEKLGFQPVIGVADCTHVLQLHCAEQPPLDPASGPDSMGRSSRPNQ